MTEHTNRMQGIRWKRVAVIAAVCVVLVGLAFSIRLFHPGNRSPQQADFLKALEVDVPENKLLAELLASGTNGIEVADVVDAERVAGTTWTNLNSTLELCASGEMKLSAHASSLGLTDDSPPMHGKWYVAGNQLVLQHHVPQEGGGIGTSSTTNTFYTRHGELIIAEVCGQASEDIRRSIGLMDMFYALARTSAVTTNEIPPTK